MKETFTRVILKHVADTRYEPASITQIANDLRIDDNQLDAFKEAANDLAEKGQVVLSNAKEVSLPPPGREMIGSFRLNPKGFGFVIPETPTEHGDLFVPPGKTGGALTGDTVRCRVVRERGRAKGGKSPYTGKVVEILTRADQHYVGNLVKRGRVFYVEVDGKTLQGDVIVRDPGAKNAQPGDKVVIEMLHFPDGPSAGEAVITEVLGERGLPDVETVACMRAHGLADSFAPEVTEAARKAAGTFDDDHIPDNRFDLTKLLIVTIDPPDARDFDDAISIRRISEGNDLCEPGYETMGSEAPANAVWELGVHIADVAHFVKPGTALDDEAYERGNSTYLPRRVVPMLPELLSNGVCSLQEKVNRFTKTAFLYFDEHGKPVGSRFTSAVIRSAKRFTYLEAQAVIDGDIREAAKHARTEAHYPKPIVKALKQMDELAKVIRARRMKEGMIVLGLPEVELVFDDAGNVIDATKEDDAFTHKVIEMFMVEANEAVARLFNAMPLPMIRRIHPDPPVHDLSDLRSFARIAGYNIPERPRRGELQDLLEKVRDTPAQTAVHMGVLRTLSKAEYSPLLIGHFALASEHYTHFTSPIRRYPDLIIHRALEAYCEAFPNHQRQMLPGGKELKKLVRDLEKDKRIPDDERLHKMGKHCSGTERNSESAERDLRSYLVLDLLEREHLGDDFEGTVTGMTNDAIFVQLDKYLIDGRIAAEDLSGMLGQPGERWKRNRNTGALVAQRSGRSITIGDRFTVRVSKVVPTSRQLDLVIIAEPDSQKKKRKQPQGAANAHSKTMKLKQKRGKDSKGRGQTGPGGQPGRSKAKSRPRGRKKSR